MAPNASLRVLRLRTLIDHPRTGDAERAAARRMLDRILRTPRTTSHSDDRTYGARHGRVGRHASLSRIADMIRDDIALARAVVTASTSVGAPAVPDAITDAPPEIRFVVETPHESSIVVTIDGVPREWGWDSDGGIETVSAQLRALAHELAEIMDGYNHDGTTIGKRFFGSVRTHGETLLWR